MTFEEKTMKTERIYDGKILNLRIDTVELPDKKYSKREIVEHPGAVAIVPITAENEIIMVRQYRKSVEQELLEIPAGKLESGEDPKDCAIRELMEETGISANKIDFVFEFFPSPGFSNEKMNLFLATELEEGEAKPEADEYIEISKIKIDKLIQMIYCGELLDAKSIIGIMTAYEKLKNDNKYQL